MVVGRGTGALIYALPKRDKRVDCIKLSCLESSCRINAKAAAGRKTTRTWTAFSRQYPAFLSALPVCKKMEFWLARAVCFDWHGPIRIAATWRGDLAS
jgi:hypothetical protein